jgi:hypothetical protein
MIGSEMTGDTPSPLTSLDHLLAAHQSYYLERLPIFSAFSIKSVDRFY